MKPPSTTATPLAVTTVSVKLPEFFQADPESWFQCAEAQFGIRAGSNDETKFWHVLAALDAETSAHTARTIFQAKTRSKYQAIKEFLIKTFSPSCWERAEQILSLTDLGDWRPLAIVNYMLSTLGDFGPEILMQQIFLKLLSTPLPSMCRMPWLARM